MTDDLWNRNEPDSPCQRLCAIHPEERLCVGCLRTLAEIAGWQTMTPAERSAVIADLPLRAPRLARRRGGRIGRLDR